MACGLALKRPHGHEYESYLADDGYGGEAKRARTATHCSPFRPQMGTIAANLPSTSNFAKVVKAEENSPFAYIADRFRLSPSQLDSYIRSEVKSLKRRKLIPNKTSGDGDGSTASSSNDVSCRKIYRAPKSPAQSGSDSDEDVPASSSKASDALKEAKFTIAQVSLICDRLMKEQETRMRYEFEAELRKKLDEQHEQYVQFCAEQLSQNRADTTENDYSYSYLS